MLDVLAIGPRSNPNCPLLADYEASPRRNKLRRLWFLAIIMPICNLFCQRVRAMRDGPDQRFTLEQKLAARLWAQCSPAVAALRKVLAQLTK